MLTKLITEFLRNTDWGELDVLVMDLPPGTGDVQLTLTQQIPITGGVIVTTPQDVALADVRRGLKMFEQMGAPVLGIIENMSFHTCPPAARNEPFGTVELRASPPRSAPLLGEVPWSGARSADAGPHRRRRSRAPQSVPARSPSASSSGLARMLARAAAR
jgi:Mrp family chromosome partitioning ATPase